jgi:hypothetical protein
VFDVIDTVSVVWEQFRNALEELGIEAELELVPGKAGWDAVGSIEGVDVVVELKSNPAVGDVFHVAGRDSGDAYKVLVGRTLWNPVRDAANARGIGWFDGRGHLRLWHRPLLVDSDVATPKPDASGSSRWRLESPSALDVALAVLDGTAASGVRATATAIGRSPSTVSKQLAALRARYLADDGGHPLVPALFDCVLAEWRPTRVPLAGLPRVTEPRASDPLVMHTDEPASPGWVLADASAAAAWGAPVMLATDAPPDFYVPDAATVNRAKAMLGGAEFGRHACTVAAAPCPYVCRRRFERFLNTGSPAFAPSPVVAALDLASDPARGREILEQWSQDLPPELPRVW